MGTKPIVTANQTSVTDVQTTMRHGTMIDRYTMYVDPNYSYLKVPRKELIEKDILSKTSSRSFRRGQWVLLREGADMNRFMKQQGQVEIIKEFTLV